MTFIDRVRGEINFKVVYYRPGLSGKTTNMQVMHETYPVADRGKMISLATDTDRTVFCNFVSAAKEKVGALTCRVYLYTVPGPVFYDSSRAMILKGVDGVVAVADSQEVRREANLRSFEELESNLAVHGIDASTFPIVLQYNKRDRPNVMSVAEMDAELNPRHRESLPAIAFKRQGVFETFERIWSQVFARASAGEGKGV